MLIVQDFQIDQRLSAGAFGTVYLAHHRLTGERVAIKVSGPTCPCPCPALPCPALPRSRPCLELELSRLAGLV